MVEGRSYSSLLRTVGRAVSSVCGGFLILVGAISLLAAMASGPPAVFVSATGFMLGGGLLLPPISALLRRRFPLLRPLAVPPLGALGLVVISLVIAGLVSLGSTPPADAVQPSAVRSEDIPRENQERTRDDILREAEGLIAEGTPRSTTAAMNLLNNRFGMRAINRDQELGALYERASRASNAALLAERAEAYASQAQGPWLEAVRAVSLEAPTEPEEIWRRLRVFEEAARQVAEGSEFSDDPDARAARLRLRTELVSRQRAAFPVLRAAYGSILDRLMWERDVDVIVQGAGNSTIRFVAAMFAANRNIATSQRAAAPNLDKLRFSRSQYEWYRGSEATYYTLTTPGDEAVGYWQGGAFVAVD